MLCGYGYVRCKTTVIPPNVCEEHSLHVIAATSNNLHFQSDWPVLVMHAHLNGTSHVSPTLSSNILNEVNEQY